MFKVGDLVTGTVDNCYAYTTRGAICRVVGCGRDYSDDDKSIIRVMIVGFDDDIVKDGSFLSVASEEHRRRLIEDLTVYRVKACLFEPYNAHMVKSSIEKLNDFVYENRFEYYEPKAEPVDLSSELIDFIDGM